MKTTARNNSHSHFLRPQRGTSTTSCHLHPPPFHQGATITTVIPNHQTPASSLLAKACGRSTWWRVCNIGFRWHTCIPSKATNFLFKSCKGMNHLRNTRVLRVSLQDTEPGGFVVNEEHHMLCSKPILPHADGCQNCKVSSSPMNCFWSSAMMLAMKDGSKFCPAQRITSPDEDRRTAPRPPVKASLSKAASVKT